MKYLKMFGLLAMAAAALLAFAGTASATITAPAGTKFNGTFEATSNNSTLHATVTQTCTHTALAASIAEGSTSGPVVNLSFSGCAPDTVNVLKNGTLSIASDGAVTSSGAEVTWTWHRSILGFPVTNHCIFTFDSLGTLTEGVNPAVVDLGSAELKKVQTDEFCGETVVWTGTFTINKPAGPITVD